jgi:transcriptional regulator with XRE-family HTH domain
MSVGARIVEARKLAGLTQQQLATRLGVSLRAVSRWENDSFAPRGDSLESLAKVLSVDLHWLVTGGSHESRLERDDDPEIRHPSLRAFRERFGEEYSAKTLARLRKFAAGDGQFPTTAEGWKWIAETIERGAP